ncbi:hypothetical protein GYMLUDRAFT_45014 [Collybiopsis luxurians FD-317 M1]|uniref:Uncharacterized protein n=1 Tax=Collybiopsis luxurians FD-317 M1 TaxID=944289 RepID=A0A0D0C961_9AGAR|nr:hypothetical protein GYMLUDRAFT_45014 [Collybiopsis luxurians FD-317 M1]
MTNYGKWEQQDIHLGRPGGNRKPEEAGKNLELELEGKQRRIRKGWEPFTALMFFSTLFAFVFHRFVLFFRPQHQRFS